MEKSEEMGAMEFTLLNFLKLITGKNENGRKYITQEELGDIFDVDESKVSRIFNGKDAFSQKNRDDISDGSKNIIKYLTHWGLEENARRREMFDIHNLCVLVIDMETPPKSIYIKLSNLIDLGNPENINPINPSEYVNEFNATFDTIIKYLAYSYSTPNQTAIVPSKKYNSIIDECQKAVIEAMNSFKSSVYFSLNYREEIINMDSDENKCTRSIYTKEILKNPDKEKFSYPLRRITERVGYENGRLEFLRKKFCDLKININNESLLEYIKKYVEIYPDSSARYESFIKNSEADSEAIYDLFEAKKREPEEGVVTSEILSELDIPFDKNMEEITLEIWYKSIDIYDFDRSGFSFRLRFPCQKINHCHRIVNFDKWEMSMLEFQAFYAPEDNLCNSQSYMISEDRSHTRFYCNHWMLPGTGYTRRYYYRKRSTIDAYKPEFLL
jgi:hypothetical protein